MLRRLASATLIFAFIGAICPTPAGATSTQTEVEMGRSYDEQVVSSSVIETDPLLNAYVQKVAGNLWKQVDRKDVPYNVKIVKDTEVNSFATLGGYVYINEGLIDFVQSDDELASVIGHETGHIERRHVLSTNAKLTGLNALFSIASMFSPFIYYFGNLMEAGVYAKMQRADELQADRTGLQLMSRAGYDPENMRTMMAHLAVLENGHSDVIDKYLQDHPNPDQRVSHLDGYPELDPKVVTEQQRVVQAASDRERARYEFSMLRFENILKTDPDNAEALLGLGQDQIALGYPSKSQQTLMQAAQTGSDATKALALQRIEALREVQSKRVLLTQPNLGGLKGDMAAAQSAQAAANTAIGDRREQARDQLKLIEARDKAEDWGTLSQYVGNPKHGSKLDVVTRNLVAMERSLNSALEDDTTVIDNLGSLERNKQSGLLKESASILDEMQGTLNDTPVPLNELPVLPYYPSIFAEMQHADSDMIRSVDASRASLTTLDQSLGDLDVLMREVVYAVQRGNMHGEPTDTEYKNTLEPEMKKALDNLNAAATQASQAAQLYNMARTRQLSSRITLLGLGSSPDRYATLQYALQQRFGFDGIPYQQMLHDNVTPGDVVVSTILAADIRSAPDEIVQQMVSEKKSPVDLADEHGMHAWPLEIFTGLVYLDYTDDPAKELAS
jgi:predicted Zn-dependent protease